MLDPVVQSALVVLVAYLLKLGADAVGIPLDEATLNALAAAIVAFLVGQFGLRALKRAAPRLVEKGVLDSE